VSSDDQHSAEDSGWPPAVALAVAGVLTLALLTSPSPVYASYQDGDRSTGNSLQAGSFDGKLTEIGPATENGTTDESDADRVNDTWEDYSHTNGSVDPVNNTITTENPNASYSVREVNVSASYVENDSALLNNDNPEQTAKSLNISAFRYERTDYEENITDANGNGRKDLDDLAQSTVTLKRIAADENASVPPKGIAAGKNPSLKMSIGGDTANHGDVGGDDGIDFTLYVTTVVAPSWRDEDESINNTIQYE